MAAGAPQQADDLEPSFVQRAVESLAAVVEREYFDQVVAVRTAEAVRAALAEGRYSDSATLEALAAALTRDLQRAASDLHLAVTVLPERAPTAPATADDRSERARRENFGVQRVEILDGNIGYLNLTAFYRPSEAGETISAAMRFLRGADAVIVDLRDNGGGSPDTVALLASYFFETPGLPLFDILPRSGPPARYATMEPGVAERNASRPAYVLTSARTFSAGEGFAFLLQERGRAEVVGERTAGAANPGRAHPIEARLEVTIPNGRVRSAAGGGNWEGRGVEPDVAVPAGEAPGLARERARRALMQ
jgi:C-terminal processing protease CtpA/Prc